MELGSSLEPLAPFKDKINVINGLYNQRGRRRARQVYRQHPVGRARCTAAGRSRAASAWTSCSPQHFEEETALPSLVLGCEQPVSGFHESQYSMVYASHISWRNPDSPVPIELYPSLAFDSLFGSKAGKLQGSILDDVLEQASDLRRPGERLRQAEARRIPVVACARRSSGSSG